MGLASGLFRLVLGAKISCDGVRSKRLLDLGKSAYHRRCVRARVLLRHQSDRAGLRSKEQLRRRARQPLVFLSAILFLLGLAACHAPIKNQGLSKVAYSDHQAKPLPGDAIETQPGTGAQTTAQNDLNITSQSNFAEEQAVAQGCLQAWRKAVNEKDEAAAVKMLVDLDKKHSGISTVQFMLGQVKDHFGKHSEAVPYFKKAHEINEFSSMQTFKLAESMRKSGDAKGSIPYYKKLLDRLVAATSEHGRKNMSPLLSSVRLGLARAFKDTNNNQEALAEAKRVVAADPDNKEAQELLKELEKSGESALRKVKRDLKTVAS